MASLKQYEWGVVRRCTASKTWVDVKDRFSTRAAAYRSYRPSYPAALAAYLADLVQPPALVWDCGAGNGQLTQVLAPFFSRVWATDISEPQLDLAPAIPNVAYRQCPAEQSPFPPGTIDLVVAAQAAHWFDLPAFYAEVRRVAKPGAVVALIGYGLLHSFPAADALIQQFYTGVVGPYWDCERKHLDQGYRTVPFPFAPIPAPSFFQEVHWNYEQLHGYLSTWSAVARFQQAQGFDPLPAIEPQLAMVWGELTHRVCWELFLRLGRV